MKILLIHQYFLEKDDPGGSRFNEMTKIWEREGHHITVLAGMVNGATGIKNDKYQKKWFCKDTYSDGVEVIRSFTSGAYNVNFLGRLWAYFSFVVSSTWSGIFMTKGKYDVIVVTSPPLFVGITAVVLSLFKRTPIFFEVRDLWPESAIDTGVVTNKWVIKFAFWFERFIYNKSKKINVLTPAFRKTLIKNKDVSPGKVCFIPNAADFSLSDSILSVFDRGKFRKENGYSDKFVVTYVGAHGVANALDQLLNAASILKGENILIQLIGDGMQKKMLQQKAADLGLNNVQFLNSVPKSEVFKYILASDMGASVLKRVDTFKTIYSNKTFDYMACQRPILLAIDGVSRQLVERADCGIYVEPENAQQIAEAILLAKGDVEKFEEKGKNGYHYAKEHFDREVLAMKYLKEIQNTID